MKLPIYMAMLLVFILLSGRASAGCSQTDLLDRSAYICAPYGPSIEGPAIPLLLVFHGRGGSGVDMAYTSFFHDEFPNIVVAYLDGDIGNNGLQGENGHLTGWNIQIDLDDVNQPDVAFVDGVIHAASQNYNVDMSRVYAVGHSNGALFLRVLWIMRADVFAGFAFSAAQADEVISFATPKPVFMGMGLTDEDAPFEWQSRSIGYAADRFGITADISYEEGTYLYQNDDGIALMTYIHPDGHTWPDDQTKKIADFFRGL